MDREIGKGRGKTMFTETEAVTLIWTLQYLHPKKVRNSKMCTTGKGTESTGGVSYKGVVGHALSQCANCHDTNTE